MVAQPGHPGTVPHAVGSGKGVAYHPGAEVGMGEITDERKMLKRSEFRQPLGPDIPNGVRSTYCVPDASLKHLLSFFCGLLGHAVCSGSLVWTARVGKLCLSYPTPGPPGRPRLGKFPPSSVVTGSLQTPKVTGTSPPKAVAHHPQPFLSSRWALQPLQRLLIA